MSRSRLVVYTAIIGGFNDYPHRPAVINPDVQYVVFSDTHRTVPTPWELRRPVWVHNSPRRTARYHKINADLLFPDAALTLWHDGSHQLVVDPWTVVNSATSYQAETNAKRNDPMAVTVPWATLEQMAAGSESRETAVRVLKTGVEAVSREVNSSGLASDGAGSSGTNSGSGSGGGRTDNGGSGGGSGGYNGTNSGTNSGSGGYIERRDDVRIRPPFIFSSFRHPQRSDIHSELDACIQLRKDNPSLMKAQVAGYRAAGYPSAHGLYETACIVRDHSPATAELNRQWWLELQRGSYRDQLSLNYVIWKLGLEPRCGIIPGHREQSRFFNFYKHR